MMIVVWLLVAWLRAGTAVPPLSLAHAEEPECSDQPLSFMGFWGFGEFQEQQLKPKEAGRLLHLIQITPKGWSGWSKPWKSDPLSLHGRNTLVVEVQGAEISLKYEIAKMMKWFVTWPGQQSDVTLKCSDSEKRASDDPEWVVSVDGKFEYPLPPMAVSAGGLTKVGITLFRGNTYGDVRIKASIICSRTSTKP